MHSADYQFTSCLFWVMYCINTATDACHVFVSGVFFGCAILVLNILLLLPTAHTALSIEYQE